MPLTQKQLVAAIWFLIIIAGLILGVAAAVYTEIGKTLGW